MWLVIAYAILIATHALNGYACSERTCKRIMVAATVVDFHNPAVAQDSPEQIADRYTFGNWFRATFLYTFTWLAVCFILVNPPLADISPPEVAEQVKLVDLDDPEWNQKIGDFSSTDDLNNRNLARICGKGQHRCRGRRCTRGNHS